VRGSGRLRQEAYIYGYFTCPKVLELALHDGVDPRTACGSGRRPANPSTFDTVDEVFDAFEASFATWWT